MNILSQPYFHDEQAACDRLEGILWPDGPVCPHCGVVGEAYLLKGKRARVGLRRCAACKKDFTVKVGTVFESSHVPLHKWFQATFLMASSKKGISSHQLHRTLEVTYKTAWFMAHRLREAMSQMGTEPLGGDGSTVEADETFIGRDYEVKPRHEKKGRGFHHKYKVLTLVERGGQTRSFHVDATDAKTLVPILCDQIDSETRVMTDEAGQYKYLSRHFAEHHFVRHGQGEYGRGPIHTNTIEGFFSIFKRGMKGVYQHCGKHHLHRYLAEFDFRYNYRVALGVDDHGRTEAALSGIVGKRLTYQTTGA